MTWPIQTLATVPRGFPKALHSEGQAGACQPHTGHLADAESEKGTSALECESQFSTTLQDVLVVTNIGGRTPGL